MPSWRWSISRATAMVRRSVWPTLLSAMNRPESYLDWNATAPLRPEAAAAMTAVLAHCGNPSSVHRWGRAARQMVECAREAVATLAGGDPEGVVFVSGGTEANHLALLGSGRERILVSAGGDGADWERGGVGKRGDIGGGRVH